MLGRDFNIVLSGNNKVSKQPMLAKKNQIRKNTDDLNKTNILDMTDTQEIFPSTTTENTSFFKCTWNVYKTDVCWTARQVSATFTQLKSRGISSLHIAELCYNTDN